MSVRLNFLLTAFMAALDFIETKTGRFLPGTPIRVFCQEDTESSPRTRCKPMPSLDSLRQQAISRAAPLLSKISQLDQGELLASAPIGQVMPDPYAVSFFHPSLSSLPSRPMYPDASIHILRASVIPLVSTCQMETGSKGLLLRLDGQVLYEDKKLPEDRKCAEDYSITEVRWRRFTDVHVALISVFKLGFEGYDRTFIAVPFLLAP